MLKSLNALTLYLDIANAFDTINHNAILLKLMHFGFDNQFVKFSADYLSNRTQCVFVKDEYSSENCYELWSTGSVFAVFMFAVYIDDLPSLMENSTYLFADDTKIIVSQMNLFSLQNDFRKKAIKLSKENRLELNIARFEAVFSCKKVGSV